MVFFLACWLVQTIVTFKCHGAHLRRIRKKKANKNFLKLFIMFPFSSCLKGFYIKFAHFFFRMNCEGSSSFKITFSISSAFFLEREIQLKSSKIFGSYFFFKGKPRNFFGDHFCWRESQLLTPCNFFVRIAFQQTIFEKEGSLIFSLTKFFFFLLCPRKQMVLDEKKKHASKLKRMNF